MKKIAIYGAGGLGRELGQLIAQINDNKEEWKLIGCFDDHINKGVVVKGMKILGGIRELNDFKEELNLMVGIADSNIRSTIVDRINNPNIAYPVLIHPSVIIELDEVKIGEGSVVTAGNILTTDIEIGRHCIINLGCTIGHDVVIGDYCSVMPGVHLSGNIKISDRGLIGTGARVLQNLSIGEKAKVGAGAVVTKNVDCEVTVVGVPARLLINDD